MPQILRPYQSECSQSVMNAIDTGIRRVLYTLPTGSGKTTVFAELSRLFLWQDWRVLVLAHRTELIEQGYNRIKDHCGLKSYEIGTEQGVWKAHETCKVIVGSVQTCYRANRLPANWKPDVIITDEAHHGAASTYRKIYDRFGVPNDCILIGCTATAKRTDKQSLYALDIRGNPVMLERKGQRPQPADPKESVFDKHIYEYTVLDAIEGGWLTPIRGYTVETETSLDGIKTTAGDFNEKDLAERVDNNIRTLEAISAWKQVAADRPTLVFCASVEHAHHSADLWRQAGFRADAVDGQTETAIRHEIFDKFKDGRLQVLCNMGIATEGTDLPTCSCIVHLRPTKSWNLYLQMSGRASRTWPGCLDALQEATNEERRDAIAASPKPDSLIIDLVDLYEKCGDLCTVPSILDLPVKLDLQGKSLTEAKKMLDEFEEVRERVIGECPTTYQELASRLHDVNLMRRSGAKTENKWKATEWGYKFTGVPPGYQCNLVKDGESFRLEVVHGGRVLKSKTAKPDADMKAYLDHAARHAQSVAAEHRASLPRVSRGTLDRLTPKQGNVLRRNGHSNAEIDSMPYGMARNLISKYMDQWRSMQEAS